MIMRLFLPDLIFTVKIENLVEVEYWLRLMNLFNHPLFLLLMTLKLFQYMSITHRETIILCTVYIPPNSDSDYLNSLLFFLSNLIISHDHIILVGDFNLPDVDCDTLTGTFLSSKSFCDFVFQNNLSQLIHTPTHLKGNILDLVH